MTEDKKVVPAKKMTGDWAKQWTRFEIVPLKGMWFKVVGIHSDPANAMGLELAVLKPTDRAIRKAQVMVRRSERRLRVVQGGRLK